jgi:hypothetical protein
MRVTFGRDPERDWMCSSHNRKGLSKLEKTAENCIEARFEADSVRSALVDEEPDRRDNQPNRAHKEARVPEYPPS